jgi:hypothetical protein
LLCAEPLEGRWLLSAPASEPSAPVPLRLPAEIATSLQARYPGARVVRAELTTEDDEREYDVTADYKGRTLDATFDPSGKLLEAEVLPVAAPASATPAASVEPAAPGAANQMRGVRIAPVETLDNDAPLTESQLPTPVAASLEALYPGARVVEAEASGDRDAPEVGLRAEFQGSLLDLAFTPGGKLIESQLALNADELPPAALEWVRRRFPGATIDDAQVVSRAGVVSYEMTIAAPGRTPIEATVHLAPGETPDAPSRDALPPGAAGEVNGRLIAAAYARQSVAAFDDRQSDHARIPEPQLLSLMRHATMFAAPDRPATRGQTIPTADEDVATAAPHREVRPAEGSAAEAADVARPPASLATAAFKSFVRGAAATLAVPELAGAGEFLPLNLAGVERGLQDLLRTLDAIAAPSSSSPTAAGLAGGAGAAVVLLAAAHVLLTDARKSGSAPMLVFSSVEPALRSDPRRGT